MKIRKTVEEFEIITVGTIIVAISVFFFMLPSHVSVGSGAALAIVLSNFIPLSVSTITLKDQSESIHYGVLRTVALYSGVV